MQIHWTVRRVILTIIFLKSINENRNDSVVRDSWPLYAKVEIILLYIILIFNRNNELT